MTEAPAHFFDGQTSRANPAKVRISDQSLVVETESDTRHFPLNEVVWPERTNSASRVIQLPGGASVHALDNDSWSDLASAAGLEESPVVQWQRSGWKIAASLILVVAIGLAGFRWGIPLAARGLLAFVPEQIDVAIGKQTMTQLDKTSFGPSELPEALKSTLQDRLDDVVANAWAQSVAPPPNYTLLFRTSSFGPNAFALPGGSIVLTDELVELADGNLDMVIGVLAHEIGHVEGRHSMRGISQTLLAATAMAVLIGDTSSLIASAPVMLGSLAYTRDLEREADDSAIRLMKASGISPVLMADFFRLILDEVGHGDSDGTASDLGLLFSSHPDARERIKKFEQAERH